MLLSIASWALSVLPHVRSRVLSRVLPHGLSPLPRRPYTICLALSAQDALSSSLIGDDNDDDDDSSSLDLSSHLSSLSAVSSADFD